MCLLKTKAVITQKRTTTSFLSSVPHQKKKKEEKHTKCLQLKGLCCCHGQPMWAKCSRWCHVLPKPIRITPAPTESLVGSKQVYGPAVRQEPICSFI